MNHLEKTQPILLQTEYGPFTVIAYRDGSLKEHLVLIKGEITSNSAVGKDNLLVRVHSQCLTGDTLGSLRCDCGKQLDAAMQLIAEQGGILIYLQQEGRGIGLFNKIVAYYHQDTGADTVEANRLLGFADDLREYAVAADILHDLGIKSIRLLTNNPRKVAGLQTAGLHISERVPLCIPATKHNSAYLHTKQEKLGHFLQLD